jgi:hypothetical protein
MTLQCCCGGYDDESCKYFNSYGMSRTREERASCGRVGKYRISELYRDISCEAVDACKLTKRE